MELRSRIWLSARWLLLLGVVALVTDRPANGLDPSKAFSQYMQISWNAQSGLTQKTVNAVAQTADGFVWLATEEGLIRYDGQTFVTFDERNAPGLGDRLIRSLAPTPDGGLWIGTMTGLVRYEHGHFASFRDKTEFYSDIYDLGLTGDGSVWFSSDFGLRRYMSRGPRAGLHLYTIADGLPNNGITGLAASADGAALWIGTRRGLSRYRDGRFTTYRCSRCGGARDDIVSVATGSDGGVWAGMSDGRLARWNDGRLQPAWTGSSTRGASVVNMRQDRDGTLWVAFRKLGLGRLREGKLELLTRANGLPSIDPDWIFEDRERDLWVGWAGAGLSMFRDGQFTMFGKTEGLPSDIPSSLVQAADGGLWVGTEDAGLSHLQASPAGIEAVRDRVTRTSAGLASSGNGVMALLEQRDGTLWVGSDRGSVTRIEKGRETTYKVPGLLTPGLPAMVEDAHGEPWFGFDMPDGLARLRVGHFEFKHVPGAIKALAVAPDGSLWIASYRGGVIHYANGVVRTYTQADGLSSLFLTSIYVDKEGTVWAGTQLGGLNRIKDGHITRFSVEQGLSDSTVGEVVDDGLGFLWLAGTRGIMRVALKELNAYAAGGAARLNTRTFGYEDGLRSDECNFKSHPSALRDARGRLWFATLSGLAMIDPSHIWIDPVAPQPQIEGLYAGGGALLTGKYGKSGIQVDRGQRNLVVRFAAPTFVSPEQMQLRYRLVGLEEHWLRADARQGAPFSNLPPGHYRFELQAANSQGISNGSTAVLAFEVLPRFYETQWFRVMASLSCLLAVSLGFRVRTRVLLRRTAQLEQLILDKTGEVRSALAAAEAARELLREQAMRDSLTGLWNRRAIFELLESEILRCERDGKPLAVIMADIDHFKTVNDTWGHQAGDLVIREVGERLRNGIRKQDAIGRYGGEELLILLPNAALAEGLERAEELRALVCKQPVNVGKLSIEVSCSFGLAHIERGASCWGLVGQADAALYQAKRDGRNCVRLLAPALQ